MIYDKDSFRHNDDIHRGIKQDSFPANLKIPVLPLSSFMRTSHALLLRIWHDPEFDFKKAGVEYTDRGAPNDRSTAEGEYITNLDRDYFEVISPIGTTPIPYHRILKITYACIPIWEKQT